MRSLCAVLCSRELCCAVLCVGERRSSQDSHFHWAHRPAAAAGRACTHTRTCTRARPPTHLRRYEIRDIMPPAAVRNAMELQAEAERRKRAQVGAAPLRAADWGLWFAASLVGG